MKFKRILAALLAVTVVGANMSAGSVDFPKIPITANAEGTESPLKYEELADGTIEITGCDENVTKVEIPAEIDGKKVTKIGGNAFSYCWELETITIPDSVTNIGMGAFSDTPWLEKKQKDNPLVILNGILIDGTTCSGNVVIPDGVTSIGGRAFGDCSGLTSVTIPNGVTSIGYMAFGDCSGLTEITIPDSVTNIGMCAFSDTPWLEKKQKDNPLVIVNDILIDGTTCSGNVVIPDGVTSIGGRAFGDCSGLTSVTIPNGVVSIGDWAFFDCSGLMSITIPDSIASIGISAFKECTSLTEVTIPDSVTSIGIGAFAECESLTSITIVNPDCEIYDKAYTFSNGYDNENVHYFNGTIYGYDNSTAQAYAEKYNRKFEILSESPANESDFEYKSLEDGTIEITGCDKTVTTVEIPAEIDGKKVTAIGEGAFWKYSNLTGVTIPDSVTSIDQWAFSECTGLTEITIPDSVTSIGGRAFANTPWLASKQKDDPLVIVNGILIDGNACSGDVIIPVSVTSISIAFYNCSGLTSITILNPNCEIFESRETISNGYNEENFPYFNGTIYGYDNSTAQAYAEKYNRKFESLGEAPALAMGDVNGDNTVDSSDASAVLADYSLTSTGKESPLTDAQKAAADVDKDGKIDSSDASYILQFYSYISTDGTETDMSKWLNK